MRQQMEWTMRNEEGRRQQGIGANDALEMRMREMEVTLIPRHLTLYRFELHPAQQIKV